MTTVVLTWTGREWVVAPDPLPLGVYMVKVIEKGKG